MQGALLLRITRFFDSSHRPRHPDKAEQRRVVSRLGEFTRRLV
jgi:hypothetical protein